MNEIGRFFVRLFRRKPLELADMPAILKEMPNGWLRSRLEYLQLEAEVRGEPLTIEDVEWCKAVDASRCERDNDTWLSPPDWEARYSRRLRKLNRSRLVRGVSFLIQTWLMPTLAKYRDRQLAIIALVCMFCGAFGVASGYAVFFLFIEESGRPTYFLAALLLAAVLSFIFEWLRGTIEGHERWSLSRIVVTLSMLAMAEFFVMAAHCTLDLTYDTATFVRVTHAIMGGSSSQASHNLWDLSFLAGLWIFIGAVLSGFLSLRIGEPAGTIPARYATSLANLFHSIVSRARYGALIGAIAAPLTLIFLRLRMRFCARVLQGALSPRDLAP